MKGFAYPEAAFQVSGFQAPHGEMLGRMGRWGVGVDLAATFATLAYEAPMDGETERRLGEIGNRIVRGFFPDVDVERYGIITVPGRWLIAGVVVPGNCACMFATDDIADLKNLHKHSPAEQKRIAVRYVPHNVDSQTQAACMLALWLRWYNAATAHLIKL